MKNVSRDIDQLHYYAQLMVKRIMTVCEAIIHDDEMSDQHNSEEDGAYEPVDFQKLLPEVSFIEYVLQIDQLMAMRLFLNLFEMVPPFEHYDEKVWPIPYDFTPNNVYDNGKYDINLIFGKQAPKAIAE